ncbi:MAG: hypothetical protein HUU01_00340 [Saprospiraceae bacterium]|nr:hypothetical protein [Saprospiraceae bacterium]
MKNLIEIVKIATRRKASRIELLDDATLNAKNSKFREMYEGIESGQFKNDRDAAAQLYGADPGDARYRQLKSRFRRRLLNTLFFIDIKKPDSADYTTAYFTCNKEWALVNILLQNKGLAPAADLAHQILTTALKYHFSEIIVNCARILREYAAFDSNEKAFDQYDAYILNYSKILSAEIRSEELYQRATMYYYRPTDQLQDFKKRLDGYCNELIQLSEMHPSPVINFHMYIVWVMRYEIAREYSAMLEVCDQAEQYIEHNPAFYQEEQHILFYTKKMSAYLHLKDYRRGRESAEKCLRDFSESSEVWFQFMEYYLLLAIHTENYIQAQAIFNQASNMPGFRKLDGIVREKWSIYEAYIQYLIESRDIDPNFVMKQRRKSSRLSRFLETPPSYPREQKMFHLLVMILQVLFMLQRRNFNQATEKIELIKAFVNRNLNKEEFERPMQFVRLLLRLSKARYHPDELSGAEKPLKWLSDHPFSYRGALNELEIIPYEKLWEIVLSKLK